MQQTNLLQQLVAFVHDKMLDFLQRKRTLFEQRQNSSWCSNDNGGHILLKRLNILLDGNTTIKHGSFDVGQIFRKASIFISYLKSKFACMANDQNRSLFFNGLNLLKSGENKNGGFSHATFRLTQNIHS